MSIFSVLLTSASSWQMKMLKNHGGLGQSSVASVINATLALLG